MKWFEIVIRMVLGIIGALAFANLLQLWGMSSTVQGNGLIIFLLLYFSGLSYLTFVSLKKEIEEEELAEKELLDADRNS